MKRTKIKQNSLKFQIENRLYLEKQQQQQQQQRYPISDLFLVVLLYIFKAKKGC